MTENILQGETDRAISAEVSIVVPHVGTTLLDEQGCEAASPPNPQPSDAGAEAIRVLAHRKWEAAGCPAGDGLDFWLEAERQVNAERSVSSSAPG